MYSSRTFFSQGQATFSWAKVTEFKAKCPTKPPDSSTAPLRPLIVLGTRPEAIKLCPVILECQRRKAEISPIICSTGQHREMLAQVLGYFGITPDIDLGLMKPGQTLTGLTASCLQAVDQVILDRKPDCVVVQGDTTTVMASAMAAFYHRTPVVHVEAGLRTGDLMAPWPRSLTVELPGSLPSSIVPRPRAAPMRFAARVSPRSRFESPETRSSTHCCTPLSKNAATMRVGERNIRRQWPIRLS